MDAALEKRQVKRAYKLYAPAYDFVFDWIFHPGREAAIRLLDIKPGDNVLEVGIGTGLNLPLYPANCRLTGIDLSEEMLEKAQDKVVELGLGNVTLKTMDATVMDFGQGEFDSAVATYTISAVPDPVGVLREMKRVVKPGGNIVILNHFRSERPAVGRLEDLVAPVCTRLGWKSNLPLEPLLRQVGLIPDLTTKVNLFKGWRLIKCVNPTTGPSNDGPPLLLRTLQLLPAAPQHDDPLDLTARGFDPDDVPRLQQRQAGPLRLLGQHHCSPVHFRHAHLTRARHREEPPSRGIDVQDGLPAHLKGPAQLRGARAGLLPEVEVREIRWR